MPSTFQQFLFTKDLIDHDVKLRKQTQAVADAISDEEKKKARNALILTVVGGLINPAFAIAGGMIGRHGTDLAMDSESKRVTATKYSPSETAEINREFEDLRPTKLQDYGQDLKSAVSILMLGGLSDKIADKGVLGALGDKSTWTTYGGKRAPLSLSNLLGDWSHGGGG